MTMHEDPACASVWPSAWSSGSCRSAPSSYDDIRMMLEACEAAGFMQVR